MRRAATRLGTASLAGALLLAVVPAARAATPKPHPLFRAPSMRVAEQRQHLIQARRRGVEDGGTVLRSRMIGLNLDRLSARETLSLSLFDGLAVTAVRDRVERNQDGLTWVGHVRGKRFSHVTLATRGALVSGLIGWPGRTYRVSWISGDLHVLQRVVEAGSTPCRAEATPEADAGGRTIERLTSLTAPAAEISAPAIRPLGAEAVVDVLVVYTTAARDAEGSDAAMRNMIDVGMADANQAFVNSNVGVRLQWGYMRVDYEETGDGIGDLARLREGVGTFAAVHAVRNQQGYDLVQLITKRMRGCGWGYTSLQPSMGFSIVWRGCYRDGRFSATHEIGHNFGSDHERSDAGPGRAFDFSVGYREPGRFRTVMATECSDDTQRCPGCAPCPVIQHFSNPDVNDPGSGRPTGIPIGQPDAANNAASINETRWQVAAYRGPQTPDPGAPSNLIAEVLVGHQSEVQLTWQDNSDDETGFRIERAVNDGEWTLLAQVDAGAWSYLDTTATPSSPPTTYHYRVQAARGSRRSAFSNVASAVMSSDAPSGAPVLAAPKGCVTSLRPPFSWTPVPNATLYWLIVSENPDFTAGQWVINTSVSGTSYTPSADLLPGRQYYWKVKAQSSSGFGPWSLIATFKPFCSANEPPLLTGPLACTTQQTPAFSWTPVAGATGYWLIVSDTWDMNQPGAVWWVNTVVPGTSYVPPVSFPIGVPFYFKVKSVFGDQGGAWSLASSFTAKVNCTPPVVTVSGGGACHPPCTRTFTATATDPDNDPLTFSWSGCASGTGTTATCTATTVGTLAATVTVSDGHGAPASASATLTGVNQNPTVSLGVPDTCGVPCTMLFTATGSDPDADALSYSWSGCATGSASTAACTVGAQGDVTATVTVTDGVGGSATATLTARAPEPIAWTGASGVLVAGSTLTKNSGVDGYGDAGAISVKVIASGRGYAEFTATDATRGRIFGLSRGDGSLSDADVDFGLAADADGQLAVFESGVFQGSFGPYAPGDRLRVAVDTGVVTYHRNGAVIYTSTTAARYPLLVDTAFAENGAAIAQAVMWGDLGESVFWTYGQGVAASLDGLVRQSAPAGWSAGAISSRVLARGNGSIEFAVGESNTGRMCGLSHGDANASYTDIDFALYPAADGIVYVYEAGISRGSFGSYAAGDRFRVAVESGAVRYYRNDALLYTSAKPISYPLLVDTSLYTPGATIQAPVLRGVLASNVAWQNLVQATASGNGLTRGNNEPAWDAGASSGKAIVSGDGFMEFTAPDVYNVWMAGLGTGDSGPHYGDIEYAIYGNGEGYYLFEGGLSRGFFGTFEGGDRFRVAVESGVVKYYRNGAHFYSSGVAPQYPLRVDTSLYSPASYYTPPASLVNVVIGGRFVPNQPPTAHAGGPYRIAVGAPLTFSGLGSRDPDGVVAAYHWSFGDGTVGAGATPVHAFAAPGPYTVTLKVTDDDGAAATATVVVTVTGPVVPENVAWTQAVGALVYGNTLVRAGTESGWDAGAVSLQSIPAGNCYVEFTAPDVYNVWMAGLGNGNTSPHYGDIEFAIYGNGEGYYLYESGISRGFMGIFEGGDRFRVAVESGRVKYYRNGALFYTSTVTPAYPLLFDTSLHSVATYYTPPATISNAVIAAEH
jgi:hypothetical protein